MNSYDTSLLNKVTNDSQGTKLTSRIYPDDFPTLASGTPYTDTDLDGMEDNWETARGLNPSVADNNGDDDSDGYTNLEEFLHYLTE